VRCREAFSLLEPHVPTRRAGQLDLVMRSSTARTHCLGSAQQELSGSVRSRGDLCSKDLHGLARVKSAYGVATRLIEDRLLTRPAPFEEPLRR
jgi:hypothetical protein